MRITLLGTGGPRPDPHRQGPATLVEVADLKLLFDAGRGVATQLAKVGVSVENLDGVLLTHHHYDHIGGLGDVLMAAWNNGRDRRLPVHGPTGTIEIVAALLDTVYAPDIRFRVREAEMDGESVASIADIVDVTEGAGLVLHPGDGVSLNVEAIEHGGTGLGFASAEWQAVGYRVESAGRSVAIAGDAVAGQGLTPLARDSDALVISCYLALEEISTPADEFLTTAVLAGPRQLADIAATTRTKRLVLTHFREKSAAMLENIARDVAEHYDGEVMLGEDLTVVEL